MGPAWPIEGAGGMTTFANQLLAPDKAIWNGLCLNLKLADNETGYEYVIKQKDRNRKKPYIVKFSVDGEKGQKTLHDSSSAEAWEAAAKWAAFKASGAVQCKKEFHQTRRSPEVSWMPCFFSCCVC